LPRRTHRTDPDERHSAKPSWYPEPAVIQIAAVFHVLVSVALLTLILMHSGRDAGMGGMGFTPASQGGTHIVERNLTRLTVVVASVFFLNTVLLYRLLA
jgi:preprotein translocase subunit SecG